MTTAQILLLLVALQAKHTLADFWWQSSWMIANKGRYLHPGGLCHAGLHAALTLAILLGLSVFAPALAVMIAMVELVVHYHIDWAKERAMRHMQPDLNDSKFWRGIGLDQLLHQMTYIALLWVALNV